MLREAARVLADDLGKRVIVVDTTNEIAGDGDIPHPAIGKARRMQVRTPALQHEVMIEAVENHMPEVIVIDEIGTELEAQAARTIAERGVQLVGTAHGNTLDNLMLNPTLSDLIGGIQSVTLGDEEARRRRTQKSVLERKAPPTFDVIVEIQDRERVMVHADVSETVDAMLRGDPVAPELRWKDEAGVHKSQSRPRPSPREQLGRDQLGRERFAGLVGSGGGGWRPEPGWRGTGDYRTTPWDPAGGSGPGYRPGASGGWRESARPGRRGRRPDDARRADRPPRRARRAAGPGGSGRRRAGGRPAARAARRRRRAAAGSRRRRARAEAPFVAGEIADRGPVERAARAPRPRSRRAPATPASGSARRNGATRPRAPWRRSRPRRGPGRRTRPTWSPTTSAWPTGRSRPPWRRTARRSASRAGILPTLRVFPHGDQPQAAGAGASRSSSCRSSWPASSTRRTWS